MGDGASSVRGAAAVAYLGAEPPVDTLGALKQANAQESSAQDLGGGHGQACTKQCHVMKICRPRVPDIATKWPVGSHRVWATKKRL